MYVLSEHAYCTTSSRPKKHNRALRDPNPHRYLDLSRVFILPNILLMERSEDILAGWQRPQEPVKLPHLLRRTRVHDGEDSRVEGRLWGWFERHRAGERDVVQQEEHRILLEVVLVRGEVLKNTRQRARRIYLLLGRKLQDRQDRTRTRTLSFPAPRCIAPSRAWEVLRLRIHPR